MTDPVQQTTSTLMLHTTTAAKVINLTLTVPVQVMRLRSYRIEFADAATALAAKIVYLDLGASYYDSNTMLDGNVGRVFFPFFVDFSAATLETSCNIPINLSKTLPEQFTMRLLNSNFAPITGLVSFHALFELELGHSF